MPRAANGAIRIGVGGWTYPPWRGVFYPDDLPQKRELEYASRQLNSIEINGTYYGSQKPSSFAKWRDETPEDFVFSVKGPRFTTNRRVLAQAGESVERFFASGVLELGEKLGPVNWQFSPNKKFDPEDFAAFLKLLPHQLAGRTIRHVVEVRNQSFRCAALVELAQAHGVAIVRAGDSEFPEIADLTAPFVYARIMGATAEHEAGYAPEAIASWAKRAAGWAAGQAEAGAALLTAPAKPAKRDVFLYVISGHKVLNPAAAMRIIEQLKTG